MMPATYNIEYYRGDTFKLYLNIKDNTGMPINVTGYTASFTIATERGDSPSQSVACSASASGTQIQCQITADQGEMLVAGTPYVYDIKVDNGPEINTYLTGNVNVTEKVT